MDGTAGSGFRPSVLNIYFYNIPRYISGWSSANRSAGWQMRISPTRPYPSHDFSRLFLEKTRLYLRRKNSMQL